MKYTHKLAEMNMEPDVTKQDFVRLYSLFLSRFLCTIFSSLCSPHLSSARSITTLLPYFLGYRTDFFPSKNDPKDLDPSYKTDLDL